VTTLLRNHVHIKTHPIRLCCAIFLRHSVYPSLSLHGETVQVILCSGVSIGAFVDAQAEDWLHKYWGQITSKHPVDMAIQHSGTVP